MNIYELMKKPLSTKDEQDRLIQAYSKYGSSLYYGLIRSYSSQKEYGKIKVQDCDDFYVYLFRTWRRGLSRLIQSNNIQDEYKSSALAAYRYVSSFSPKTKSDVLKIMDYKQILDPIISAGVKKFRWNSIGEYSGWNHIHSNLVNLNFSKTQEIKHRIYVNCDSSVTHKIMLRFLQKCSERHCAYYFKYDSYGDRDDNLVFYCDTEHLESYITILREIMREERLQNSVHHPPICTASIDGWLGYGSEPLQDKDDQPSFNEKRESFFGKSIQDITGDWMLHHSSDIVPFNGRMVPYRDVIVRTIVDKILDYYESITPCDEKTRQKNGFNGNDLKSVNTKNYLSMYVNRFYDRIMSYYLDRDHYTMVQIPFYRGSLNVFGDFLEDIMQYHVQYFWDNHVAFRRQLMDHIHSSARKNGIDPDNMACDLYVVDELGKNASPNDTSSRTRPTTRTYQPQTPGFRPRRTKSGYIYKPMTDAEIEESRRKLGL